MTTPDLTLYGERFWISPYTFTVFVALREKDLPFKLEVIALDRQEQKRPEFRRRSVTAKVPALDHGDFSLAESSAIVEYLDEAFPHKKVLPEDLRDRARARQIMAWIRSDLMPIREERPTTTMFYERATVPLSPAGQAAADRLLEVAGQLIGHGATTLFGKFSIADVDLAFMLHRLILNGHDVPAHIAAFASAQWQRPSVREFVERERPPYVGY